MKDIVKKLLPELFLKELSQLTNFITGNIYNHLNNKIYDSLRRRDLKPPDIKLRNDVEV